MSGYSWWEHSGCVPPPGDPGLRGPGGRCGAKLLGQPHTSRQAEISQKVLPSEGWRKERALMHSSPLSMCGHTRCRIPSCPLLGQNPILQKKNPQCYWCEGLCVKNKNTVLSKSEQGSRERSMNPCQWQTGSATWRRCCWNWTVEGWAEVSRHVTRMTSRSSGDWGRWTCCWPILGVALTWAPK